MNENIDNEGIDYQLMYEEKVLEYDALLIEYDEFQGRPK